MRLTRTLLKTLIRENLNEYSDNATDISEKLMSIDSNIWNKLNIHSGTHLYASHALQLKYADELKKMIRGKESLIKSNATAIYSELEDNNYHSLINALALMGLLGSSLKNWYINKSDSGNALQPHYFENKFGESVTKRAKKYKINAGFMGNGMVIWNSAHEVRGDYETVAHVGDSGEVRIYDKNMPPNVKAEVQQLIDDFKRKLESGNHTSRWRK